MVFLRKTLYCLLALFTMLPLQAKKPSKTETLSVEQEKQFSYYWYAAKQAIEQERYADAYTLLEFCRSIKPHDGQTLTFLGIIYDGLGQKEMAIDCFRQAYEADPEGQWQRYLDWQLHQQLEAKQWNEALKTLDEIDKYKKDLDGQSAYLRFRLYLSMGKTKKGLAVLDKYLETDPDNLQFLVLRMELMEHMHASPKTLYAMYDKILELDPTNIMVLNNYAYFLCINKGDLQKAERMSAITIREQPNNPVYLDTYGWILHMQGKDDLALFYLQRALGYAEDGATKTEIEKHLKEVKGER